MREQKEETQIGDGACLPLSECMAHTWPLGAIAPIPAVQGPSLSWKESSMRPPRTRVQSTLCHPLPPGLFDDRLSVFFNWH